MKRLALVALFSLCSMPAIAQTDDFVAGRPPANAGGASHVADRDRRRARRRRLEARGASDGFHPGRSARGPAGVGDHRSPHRLRRRLSLRRRALPRQRSIRHRRQRDPQGLRRPRSGHLRGVARHVRRSPQRLRLLDQLRAAPRPTRKWRTRAATSTRTGMRCGGSKRGQPRRAGPPNSAFPSRPFASRPARARAGASISRAACDARTSSATGRRSRAPIQSFAHPPRATLIGLPPLQKGRNLRIKPFLAAGAVRGVGENGFDRDLTAGVDIKAGITPSLTFDATINPDFAQAEADEQQVNLTQFSLFFPEKREFFLENAGIFYFGDIPAQFANGGAVPSARRRSAAVLQPPHRPERRGRTAAAARRRAAHRPRRRLHARLDDDAEQGRGRDGRAPTTRSRACGAICSAAPTSAPSSCRASRTATATISIASSASTRTSGSSGTSASTASSRDRNRPA